MSRNIPEPETTDRAIPSNNNRRSDDEALHKTPLRVLVADDEALIRRVIIEFLESHVSDFIEAEDGHQALDTLTKEAFDVAFLDIRMPGFSGLDILEKSSSFKIPTAIIIVTAGNALESAVEAMTRGASDFLSKPFGQEDLLRVFKKALRQRALNDVVENGELAPAGEPQFNRLIGVTPEILDVFKTVGRVAKHDVPILITGESGTGKELVARAAHKASQRSGRPFVAVNSAAIPKDLLESELFGHEKGAFTGAVSSRPGRFKEADGGTLFLDEIGDMPLSLQAKLLRVLQEREITPVGSNHSETVDVRVVAATHRNLQSEIQAGRFRADLLYRISVVPIHIPPLRERLDDIPVLAQYFARIHGHIVSRTPRYLAKDALHHLAEYPWPGNVRELENAVVRALVMSNSTVLSVEDFTFLEPIESGQSEEISLEKAIEREVKAAIDSNDIDLYRIFMDRTERPLVKTVIEHVKGNQVQAASLLGINRNTLRKKMVEIGIKLPKDE